MAEPITSTLIKLFSECSASGSQHYRVSSVMSPTGLRWADIAKR